VSAAVPKNVRLTFAIPEPITDRMGTVVLLSPFWLTPVNRFKILTTVPILSPVSILQKGEPMRKCSILAIVAALLLVTNGWAAEDTDDKPVWQRLSLVAKQTMVLGFIHGYQAGEIISCNQWAVSNADRQDQRSTGDGMMGRCYGYYEELRKDQYRGNDEIMARMVSWIDRYYSDSSNRATSISSALTEAYISNRHRDLLTQEKKPNPSNSQSPAPSR